jgi:2'-5' RNA ligase
MDQQLLLLESRRPNDGKLSFFLALFPDLNIAERMIQLGNRILSENGMHSRLRPLTHLHVSMHFFGYGSDVSQTLVSVLDPTCKAVAAQTLPFDIELDRVMSFRGRPGNHPLVLVGDEQRNVALKKLHQSLEVQRKRSVKCHG